MPQRWFSCKAFAYLSKHSKTVGMTPRVKKYLIVVSYYLFSPVLPIIEYG